MFKILKQYIMTVVICEYTSYAFTLLFIYINVTIFQLLSIFVIAKILQSYFLATLKCLCIQLFIDDNLYFELQMVDTLWIYRQIEYAQLFPPSFDANHECQLHFWLHWPCFIQSFDHMICYQLPVLSDLLIGMMTMTDIIPCFIIIYSRPRYTYNLMPRLTGFFKYHITMKW